jgi:hypothetical protein
MPRDAAADVCKKIFFNAVNLLFLQKVFFKTVVFLERRSEHGSNVKTTTKSSSQMRAQAS